MQYLMMYSADDGCVDFWCAPCSVADALVVFRDCGDFSITSFWGERGSREQVVLNDVKTCSSPQEVVAFLKRNSDVFVVAFEAVCGDGTELHVNDDAHVTLRVRSVAMADEVIGRMLLKLNVESSILVELKSLGGRYVHVDDSRAVRDYRTFDDYIASGDGVA